MSIIGIISDTDGGVLVTIKGCWSDLEYTHLAECISAPFLIPLFPYFFPQVHTKLPSLFN